MGKNALTEDAAAAATKRKADLTVAIATLDRPEELDYCLGALLEGDMLPAQVVVVDQGQGESGRLVVERHSQEPIPFLYLRQDRLGLSTSRNAALDQAICSVIAFTDDDCVPDRGWVAALNQAFAASPAVDVVCGRVLSLGPETVGTFPVSLREGADRVDYTGKWIPWRIGTGGNMAVRRALLSRTGRFDERLGVGSPGRACEDSDVIYRLLRAGARIRYEPSAVIFHRRQSRQKRLSSRWNYGHGIGAFCGLWLRRKDLYIPHVLLSWVYDLCRELIGFALKREWMEVHQRLLALCGTAHGLAYGLRVSKSG